MRYIPSNCLQQGQKLAVDLLTNKNKILIRRGVPLTQSMIQRIRRLGFQGIYIDDNISKDIEVTSIISSELKHEVRRHMHSLFNSIEKNIKANMQTNINVLGKAIAGIVDRLLRNRNLIVNMVDLRSYDDYTYSHSINVSILSVLIGMELGMEKKTLNELALGAIIHDIGKVFVDKNIINKATKLTDAEFEEIKKHSVQGFNYICSNSNVSDNAKSAVLMHHEQYNGNGYPSNISGEDIHFFGRIVCVADVYDALVSDRPYRRAILPSDAMEYIMSGYSSMFDPKIVDAFIRKVAPYPVGTCVRLSTGDTGIVVKNFEYSCLRPKIRIIRNNKPTSEHIDLSHDRWAINVTIKEIVNY